MRLWGTWIWLLVVAVFGCGGRDPLPTANPDPRCSPLQPLADRPLLGPWKTHFVYYPADPSWLLLQVHGYRDSLIRVDLPSGDPTPIVDGLTAVVPLGNGRAFLVSGTGSTQDEVVVYDGTSPRKLWTWTGLCKFQPSPDGTRIFAIGNCVGNENGLVAIDVATGTSSIVDQGAATADVWSMVVSPHGQWIAYTTGAYDLDNRTLSVASADGRAYTIPSARQVGLMAFATDELLVFQTGAKDPSHGDLRAHVPGTGDTSVLIAADRYPSDNFQFSPGRTRVLATQIPATADTTVGESLHSIPLDGGDAQLLVDAAAGTMSRFAFDAQGAYAVYGSERAGDTASSATWVVDLLGSPPRKLSSTTNFEITRATSSVLLGDLDDRGRYRWRIVDLTTGRARFSYFPISGDVTDATPVHDDQAVLLGETDQGTTRARFVSASHPQSIVLGEWSESTCRGCEPMRVIPDPTGCFTVVNTDAAPNPGTRLVLLPE